MNHLWKRPLPLLSIKSNRTPAPDSGTPVTFQRLCPRADASHSVEQEEYFFIFHALHLLGSEPQTFRSKSIISERLGDLARQEPILKRSGSAGRDLHIPGDTGSPCGQQGCSHCPTCGSPGNLPLRKMETSGKTAHPLHPPKRAVRASELDTPPP